MTQCYLIGIGGTGARCIENYVHMSAAGLGPDSAWIGMIDQDSANGNVSKTAARLSLYNDIWQNLRRTGDHRLSPHSALFRSVLNSAPDSPFWCPLPGHRKTMREAFHYDLMDPSLQKLVNALYLDAEEQRLTLDEGYRGRPSIGAAVILSEALAGHSFWDDVFRSIANARAGEDVRIFIIGSIFGGTGAAGFPTVARLIRSELERQRIKSNVAVGGALMLPYFSFPPPKHEDDQNVARSEAFLELAQGALKYYHNLMTSERTFDGLYVLGWSPLIPLREHSKGGQEQMNPPLLPELYPSLAAMDFFAREAIPDARLYYAGRRDRPEFSWEDLPRIGSSHPFLVRERIGQFARFALAYSRVYFPNLAKGGAGARSERWFKRQIRDAGVNLKNPMTAELLQKMKAYCDRFLEWLGSISSASEGPELRSQLVNTTVFGTQQNDAWHPFALNREFGAHNRRSFASMVRGQDGYSLGRVFEELTYRAVDEDEARLGVFLGSLYRHCGFPEAATGGDAR